MGRREPLIPRNAVPANPVVPFTIFTKGVAGAGTFGIGMGAHDTDPGDLFLLANFNGPSLLKLNGSPVWDRFTSRLVLTPPGFDLSANIAAAQTMSRMSFLSNVHSHDAPWGYGGHRDLGNVNFGATGVANGLSPGSLLFGGFLFKLFNGTLTGSDLDRDQYMINVGIDYYNGGGR